LPDTIGELVSLESLNVSNNQLTSVPEQISGLIKLRNLQLQNNLLAALPSGIGNLANLESLELKNNQLASLPPEIGELVNLLELPLQSNNLNGLPAEIGKLANLHYLWAEDNQLMSLPLQIGQLTNLRSLTLHANQLRALPGEIGNLRKLTRLTLNRNRLTKLPSEIGDLSNLQELELGNNELQALPSEIGNLRKLRSLNLYHNRLGKLPSEMGGLNNLTSLSISNNQLAVLPSEIGGLTRLQSLDLDNNQLATLPREICDLQNLQSLSLLNNQLTRLPDDIRRLEKLQTLKLQEGQRFPLPLSSRIRDWDVFISHASEDKESVALPLAQALRAAGLKVWLDQEEIKLGDSIRRKIDEGLSKSRYGVVILSETFLEKAWTQKELNGLLAIEDHGEKIVLPVWHNISKTTLVRYSPMLSDLAAANTQDGIPRVASQIVDVVLYSNDSPSSLFPTLTGRFVKLLRDSNSSPTSLRDFVFHHPNIIEHAFGYYCLQTISPETIKQQPSLLAHFQAGDTFKVNSRNALIFAWWHTPVFKRVVEYADLAESNEWNEAVIVSGRRHELNEIEKERIRDFNEASRLKLRSYDWLIDACLYLDQHPRRY
jgi:Leucine-rich repeat (LRR) protein